MQREIKGVISLQTTKNREKERGDFKMKFNGRSPRLDFETMNLNHQKSSKEDIVPESVRNKKVKSPPFIKKLDIAARDREEHCITNTKTDPTE